MILKLPNLHNWFTLQLGKLPNRTKRLIFLASFSARVKEAQVLDNDTLKKLNEIMNIAGSEDALKLPVQLSKAIWDGQTVFAQCRPLHQQGPLQEPTMQDLVQQIKNAMPKWLHYGREGDVEADLTRLLQHKTEVFG